MLKNILIGVVSVIGLCSVAFADMQNQTPLNDIVSQEVMIVILLALIVVFFAVGVLFIMSQKKLSNSLTNANDTPKIHGAWFWTQLIPLWNIIALVVSQVKVNGQYKIFMQNHSSESVGYSINLLYWYLGLSFVGMIPIIGVLASLASMVVFLIFWSKMSKATKQINAILESL
jgi:heme/copper-type cytochrome/quinol oxidase subunit 2